MDSAITQRVPTDLPYLCSLNSFYKNNVAFLYGDELRSLISDLSIFGISYLTYEFYKKDGHFRLTTHPHWIDHYYRNELYRVAAFENIECLQGDGLMFWLDMEDKPVYKKAREFDINAGFTFYFKEETGTHIFHFGRPKLEKDSRVLDINHMENYKKFAGDFLDKTRTIRYQAEKQLTPNFELPQVLASKDILALIAGSKLPASNVCYENNFLVISDKEARVALGLLRGQLIKQISYELQLSERSIKTHIQTLKRKVGATNLVQLGLALDRIRTSSAEGI